MATVEAVANVRKPDLSATKEKKKVGRAARLRSGF
jgi:hypothetical protein